MLRHVRLTTLVALCVIVPAVAAAAAPFAYITNSNTGTISVLDLASGAETDTITLPGSALPWGVALSPDGKTLYASNFGNGNFFKVDLATKVAQPIAAPALAFGVAVHPSGSPVFVTHNSSTGGTSAFDTTTFGRTAVMSGSMSSGAAINVARGHLYVANRFGVRVLDLATYALIRQVSMGQGFGVAVHPAGTTFYVALPSLGQLAIIDAASFAATFVTLTGAVTPQGVAVSPDGKWVYTSNYGSANVSVVNAETGAFVRNVSVGMNPYGLQFAPDSSKAYVANWGSHNVSVINTTTFTVTSLSISGRAPVAFGLFIFGQAEQIIEVAIDITPGGNPNTINLKAKGTLPVAILGSEEFNVADVDPTTVTFAGAPVVIKKNGQAMASYDDVNGDGYVDIVVHVDREQFTLKVGDTEGVLEGKTNDGKAFRGKGSVRVLN